MPDSIFTYVHVRTYIHLLMYAHTCCHLLVVCVWAFAIYGLVLHILPTTTILCKTLSAHTVNTCSPYYRVSYAHDTTVTPCHPWLTGQHLWPFSSYSWSLVCMHVCVCACMCVFVCVCVSACVNGWLCVHNYYRSGNDRVGLCPCFFAHPWPLSPLQ